MSLGEREAPNGGRIRAEQGTAELVREIAEKAQMLARKEVQLARAELRQDVKTELGSLKGAGAAAMLAVWGVCVLFVAGALAVGLVIAPWLAALLVGLALLLVAGGLAFWAWAHKVDKPLSATRQNLQDNVDWAKRRLS
ncbi:MAG: phage holin family protein [Deltaproteobacteria bacterium]|nr:phage holin family protein [Deltaproteobacteria bacterium]